MSAMKNDNISSILITAAFCAMIGVFFLLSLPVSYTHLTLPTIRLV